MVGCSFSAYLYDAKGTQFYLKRHFNLTGFNEEINSICLSKDRFFAISDQRKALRVQYIYGKEADRKNSKDLIHIRSLKGTNSPKIENSKNKNSSFILQFSGDTTTEKYSKYYQSPLNIS